METFPGAATRVLQEFRTLLQHGPHMLGSTHMLQIITINMFAIHNANSKGNIVHNLMIMMMIMIIIISNVKLFVVVTLEVYLQYYQKWLVKIVFMKLLTWTLFSVKFDSVY